uniref:Ubiquitin carboxyl-terminal hydrolase n=1 Tax=Colletotrichum fructicola (strain Nara gc5) TaxID=1213859 RepID=L2G2A1_COLFN
MSSTNPDPSTSAPAFIPLEANPELMTTLLHKLGLSPALAIHDVFSLTDADMLSFIPRPALAVLLVFPVSAAYESHRLAEDALLEEYQGKGPQEPVLWFRQTIRNACGLMGLLHAVSNGPAREYIPPREDACAGHGAPRGGLPGAPQAADDVDLHYVCFVRGNDGTLWELDGRRKGPLARGQLEEGEDVLSEKALTWGPLKFLEREGADLRFSAVALAGSMD